MNEKQDLVEWLKKLPAWIRASIGLVSLIIGFIVLVLSDIHLGVTVSIALILLTGFCISIYLAFSRKASEIIGGKRVYRFPRYRKLALVGIVLIPLLTLMLLVNKSSRSFATIAFVNTLPLPNDLSITGMIVAEAEENYRVEVTAFNPLDQDIFVSHINLSQHSWDGLECSGASTFLYILSDEIMMSNVESGNLTFKALIFPQSEQLSGYRYVAQGSARSNCGRASFQISFDTSIVLNVCNAPQNLDRELSSLK